jgi:hypothetical protein
MSNRNYRQRVIALDVLHNLGLQSEEYRAIMKKLDLTTIPLTDDEVLAVVEKEKNTIRRDPLKEEIKKNQAIAATERGVCPICGVPGETIELLGGRPAFYCKVHRAVIPAVKELKE